MCGVLGDAIHGPGYDRNHPQGLPQGDGGAAGEGSRYRAKAAEACAIAGSVEKGVEVALDVEQLLYEVNTFLNAASMIRRIAQN
jgi:hypothetical protein